MKKIKYIFDHNASLLERGDRLRMTANADMIESERWEGPKTFDITVSDTFLHSIHGPRIYSVEKIGPAEEDDFYLADDWTIEVLYDDEK